MATLAEIEDGIRRLHKIDPNDPRIRQLGAARAKLLAGGGEAPAEQPGLMERMANSMAETGKNVRESVMNPGQSIPDMLRSTSDFLTFGLNDRLRAAVKGTDYEAEKAETQAADTRLGSIDDAFNLGTALVQPSAAGKYAARTGNTLKDVGKKALAYGTEGAALSGADAVIHGEDPINPMLFGGGAGAGGSVLGDVFGKFFGQKDIPEFKNEEDLFAKSDVTPQNTSAGKDYARRAARVREARMAQTQGRPGFQTLFKEKNSLNREQSKMTLDQLEQLSRLAHQPNKSKISRAGIADALQGGGGGWGKLATGLWNFGVIPGIGAAVRRSGQLMDDVSPKEIEKYKKMFLQGSGGKSGGVAPETIDMVRNLIAKLGASSGRQNPPTFVDPKTIDSWKGK
jgi:hypothetical protein